MSLFTDLVIVSVELFKFIESMEVDSKSRVTPFKVNKDHSLSYPDHFAVLLSFRGIPLKKNKSALGKKYTRWNLNKKYGWNVNKELITINPKLESIANCSSTDLDFISNSIEKELKTVKFKAFGKVKVRNHQRSSKLESLMKKRSNLHVMTQQQRTFLLKLKMKFPWSLVQLKRKVLTKSWKSWKH